MIDIILGRTKKDREELGTRGAVLIGKLYVKMGMYHSLANNVYLDVVKPHVVLIVGKRGSGKSYTAGVITEGVLSSPRKIRKNISILSMDTMGIYWTTKYPNTLQRELLYKWNLEPKGFDVRVLTPFGWFDHLKEMGVPVDERFGIRPEELEPLDWVLTFGLKPFSPLGVLIQRVVGRVKENFEEFSLDDIEGEIEKEREFDVHLREGAKALFENAKRWGIFGKEGLRIEEITKAGTANIVDISLYGDINIKAMVIGLIAKKILLKRMYMRKIEELIDIGEATESMLEFIPEEMRVPIVWMIIDEAHEFLPHDKVTPATDPLVLWLREGRQPGCSLILITQQPGKIHTDAITQSDILISHMVTARMDIDALNKMMQTYLVYPIERYLMNLPKVRGAALVLDDKQEKVYPIQIRPRFSWHGGREATALRE